MGGVSGVRIVGARRGWEGREYQGGHVEVKCSVRTLEYCLLCRSCPRSGAFCAVGDSPWGNGLGQ